MSEKETKVFLDLGLSDGFEKELEVLSIFFFDSQCQLRFSVHIRSVARGG